MDVTKIVNRVSTLVTWLSNQLWELSEILDRWVSRRG